MLRRKKMDPFNRERERMWNRRHGRRRIVEDWGAVAVWGTYGVFLLIVGLVVLHYLIKWLHHV